MRVRPSAMICALLAALAVSSRARAEDPKIPEVKAPDKKDVKVPDTKDVKVPDKKDAKAPKKPEAKEPEKPKLPGEAKVPEGELPKGADQPPAEAPPDEDTALPPELTGAPRSEPVKLEEADHSSTLTIEEIVNSLVQTASNRPENQLTAPAWMIIITADDIKTRGYRELTDLLDDLPGMDVVRPWGDTYFKDYWRGYRNTIGAPYLLMIDGMIFNQLWLNEAEIMAAFPLSNIERVEVVYGPASAVYGPNAAMGVINVITAKKDSHTRARISLQSPQRSLPHIRSMDKAADGSVLYKGDGYTVSLTGRVDFGVLDPNIGENFEWTKSQYYSDTKLWGDFTQFSAIAGSFRSPSEKQAMDARLYLGSIDDGRGETELALQYFRMKNGTGVVYPADKLQASTLYTMLEESIYLRHVHRLSPQITSTSFIRYRISNIDSPTTDLERITSPTDPHGAVAIPSGSVPIDSTTTTMDQTGTSTVCVGVASPCVRFQYWEAANWGLTAQQDFDAFVGQNLFAEDDKLFFGFGMKYERKDLERRYIRSGRDWDPSIHFNEPPFYQFPTPLQGDENLSNRSQVDVFGIYALGTYNLFKDHFINAGLRVDYNAILGEVEPTFRGGYVGQFLHDFTLKLLYGMAVQEPTWRDLFGAWNGSGANPGLKSERSQTVELSLSYKIDWLALQGNVYLVDYTNAIISTTSSGQNLGKRIVVGADLSATALIAIPRIRMLRVWAYFSPYLYAKESSSSTNPDDLVDIGDLAQYKLMGGVTLELNRYFGATALGRCLSHRPTVSTNPLRSVPEYCTLDANLTLRDVITDGFVFSLRATNILDAQYYHPGIQDADSGNTPGSWQGDVWVGSGGYNNSWLPQPGRAFMLQLGLEM